MAWYFLFWSTTYVGLFWLVICGVAYLLCPQCLVASPVLPPLKESKKWRTKRELREESQLIKDLMTARAEEGVNIVRLSATGNVVVKRGRETLLNLGTAENRTAIREDNENAHPGDNWICDGRPVLFAIVQIVIGWPVALLLYAWDLGGTEALSWSFWSTLTAVALLSVTYAKTNERIGVKRFGEQLDGYLGPGLQFIVLRALGFIEYGEIVPLKQFVWGPNEVLEKEKKEGAEMPADHLPGALGTPENPRPGIIEVVLLGRWKLTIALVIAVGVRRRYKRAWDNWLNEYESLEDIGKLIAGVASTIITTRAREVNEDHHLTREEKKDKDLEIHAAADALVDFLSRMSEVSGDIALGLLELGRERLAGIEVVNVTLASIMPEPKFRELYQKLDGAQVDRLIQRYVGEAEVERLEEMRRFTRAISGNRDNRKLLVQLEELFTQRQFATRGQSGVDTVVQAFAANQVKNVTGK